ncbi:hypothetical protein ABKV19_023497 [Rosa sericea]
MSSQDAQHQVEEVQGKTICFTQQRSVEAQHQVKEGRGETISFTQQMSLDAQHQVKEARGHTFSHKRWTTKATHIIKLIEGRDRPTSRKQAHHFTLGFQRNFC